MQVFLNGRFVERGEARISVFDAGFQHAVGLFETLMVRHGRAFRGHRHVQRLVDSARALRLSDSLRPLALLEAVELTAQRNELSAARVRLTVTGGDLNLLQRGSRDGADATVLIVAQPPTAYPDAFFEQGVLVTIVEGRANPLEPTAGHKTLNYWSRLRALQDAAAQGAGEALWFGISNHLVGGCVSNVFLVREGALLTPPARGEDSSVPSAVLPGVTRDAVIELAGEASMQAQPRPRAIDDLLSAEEVFLTNSSWGVLPVRQVEGHLVGDGAPGKVTRTLRKAWLELAEGETSAGG